MLDEIAANCTFQCFFKHHHMGSTFVLVFVYEGDTAKIALPLSVVLVLVCYLPHVTPSAPFRRDLKVAIETVMSEIDIFVSFTGNFNHFDHIRS